MCGIAGVRKFGATPITGEELVLLLCSLEHRGQHATGIALLNPEGIFVHKAAMPAWQFTKHTDFQKFLTEHLTPDTYIALLHTRWATTGNPENNENNHPMFDGETAIVHNGMISNHNLLFDQGKYKRSCATDSDIVRAIVHEHGIEEKGIRELNKMFGSAAIACVSTKYPGKLLLARSGSPLKYGFSDDSNKMYWASEENAIFNAAKAFKRVRGAWVQDSKSQVSIGSMPDNTAWIFDENQLELHQEFNVCSHYNQPDYSKGRENYHSKTRNWKKALKTEKRNRDLADQRLKNFAPAKVVHESDLKNAVYTCACGAPNTNTRGLPWDILVCHKCSKSLAEAAK